MARYEVTFKTTVDADSAYDAAVYVDNALSLNDKQNFHYSVARWMRRPSGWVRGFWQDITVER